MSNNPIGINPDQRLPVASKKVTGWQPEKVDNREFNQILFQNVTDHVWGTQAQVTNNDATFYTDSSGGVIGKYGYVTLDADDKILINHNTPLTAPLILNTTVVRLTLEMLKGNTLDLGDSGGGVPHNFRLNINNAKLCDIYTTKDFQDLGAFTDEQQRVVKNRGQGNKIKLNGRQIFSGGRPYEIFYPTAIADPYIISQNGDQYEGFKVSGSNDNVCLFRDWWDAWGGLNISGSILVPPIFNPATGVLQRKVFCDDPSGRFMRLATPYGTTGVDPDVHSRTSTVAAATIATYTSSASAEISGITDADAIKLKLGARVADAGLNIPQGTSKTTIISSIVHNGTNDNSIFLIDSETGGSASVSATGNLTIDMSGNSGVSQQANAMQRVIGTASPTAGYGFFNTSTGGDRSGAFEIGAGLAQTVTNTAGGTGAKLDFDNSAGGTYKTSGDGSGDGENRPESYQRQSYLIL